MHVIVRHVACRLLHSCGPEKPSENVVRKLILVIELFYCLPFTRIHFRLDVSGIDIDAWKSHLKAQKMGSLLSISNNCLSVDFYENWDLCFPDGQ